MTPARNSNFYANPTGLINSHELLKDSPILGRCARTEYTLGGRDRARTPVIGVPPECEMSTKLMLINNLFSITLPKSTEPESGQLAFRVCGQANTLNAHYLTVPLPHKRGFSAVTGSGTVARMAMRSRVGRAVLAATAHRTAPGGLTTGAPAVSAALVPHQHRPDQPMTGRRATARGETGRGSRRTTAYSPGLERVA